MTRLTAYLVMGTALAAGMLFQNYLYFEYVWLFAALLVAADRTALRGETQDA